jgi:hypothetical protein
MAMGEAGGLDMFKNLALGIDAAWTHDATPPPALRAPPRPWSTSLARSHARTRRHTHARTSTRARIARTCRHTHTHTHTRPAAKYAMSKLEQPLSLPTALAHAARPCRCNMRSAAAMRPALPAACSEWLCGDWRCCAQDKDKGKTAGKVGQPSKEDVLRAKQRGKVTRPLHWCRICTGTGLAPAGSNLHAARGA